MNFAGRNAYSIVFTIIGLIAVALRLHVRYGINKHVRRTRAFYLGDVFMVVGFVMALTYCILEVWRRYEQRDSRRRTGDENGDPDYMRLSLKVSVFLREASMIETIETDGMLTDIKCFGTVYRSEQLYI